MAPKRWLTDWRGVPDLTKRADFYSIYWTATARPETANPDARIFVSIATTVLVGPDGPSTSPFNWALYHAAEARGALTGRTVWSGDAGWHTELIDITVRGMAQDFQRLALEHFAWADGFHWDYFTAMSWQFPDLAPLDEVWDRVLAAVANGLRAAGKIVIGQQFHLTPPTTALNGLFLEQFPWAFQYTFAQHEADLTNVRRLIQFSGCDREILWVTEMREPLIYGPAMLAMVEAWAERLGMAVAYGRDATAEGAP